MKARDFEIINGQYYVSTNVAAAICGVTSASYLNWEKQENPPPRDHGTSLVPLHELGEWIRAEQVLKPGRGGAGLPYFPSIDRLYKTPGMRERGFENEAPDVRLKRLQADKLQLELDKSRGLLIPVDEVQTGWAKILSRVRTRLLRLPVASAPLVTGINDVHSVQQKLSDLVGEALEELASGGDDESAGLGTSETLGGDRGGQSGQVVDVGERGGPERDAATEVNETS